jgi:hypothetical protein
VLGLNGCVVTCPLEKGFVRVARQGNPTSCAFRDENGIIDYTSVVVLQGVPFLPALPESERNSGPQNPTMEEVKQTYPDKYPVYLAEHSRVEQELKVIIDRIGKEKAIKVAFQKLQDAENARDQAPEAYIAAKKAYYTLTKGDGWEDEERKRIENSEIVPTLQQLLNEYTSVDSRLKQVTKLSEVMDSVKSRTSTTVDDFRAGVELLSTQVKNVRDQLNLERRKTEEKPLVTIPIFTYLLNIVLGICILVAIVMIVRAFGNRGKNKPVFAGPVYYQ